MSRHPRSFQRSFAGGEVSEHMYSRPDDQRALNGCAKMLNFMAKPQGAAIRRPGTRYVRDTESADERTRLIPFVFSPTQSVAIAASRDDSQTVGHFRFHVDGGTLLYSPPDEYAGPTTCTFSSSTWSTVTHGLETGDEVVMTHHPDAGSPVVSLYPTVVVTEDQTFRITWAADPKIGRLLAAGETHEPQQICFIPSGGGSMPDNAESSRHYWTKTATLISGAWTGGTGAVVEYTFSETFKGDSVKGYGASPAFAPQISAMPSAVDGLPYAANTVYYVIRTTASSFQLARSKSDAQAGIFIESSAVGLQDRRVHRAYRRGDLVSLSGRDYYCIREPWCSDPTPEGSPTGFLNDHTGHAPTVPAFWYPLPEKTLAITGTNAVADTLNSVSHGLRHGEPFSLSGSAAPGGLSFGTTYYVLLFEGSPNAFQVSATPFGDPIDITAAGTAVELTRLELPYEVPHFYTEEELFRFTTTQSNDVLTLASQDRPIAELRRVGSERWEIDDVRFEPVIRAPDQPFVTQAFPGEIDKIVATVGTSPGEFETEAEHNLLDGDPVDIFGLDHNGITGTNGDGIYLVAVSKPGGVGTRFTIKTLEGDLISPSVKNPWTAPTPPPVVPVGTVQYVPDLRAFDNVYAVTSISRDNKESNASEELTINNNLSVDKSFNRIEWNAVPGATRYRVYKQQNGIYGIIGETDGLAFEDDNIGPDLSISPSIPDPSLRRTSYVTFDLIEDTVLWPEHGIEDGAPVIFHSNGAMPGLQEGQTYYVLNGSEDSFQVTDTPTGTVSVNLTGTDSGEHWGLTGFFPSAVTYFEQRRVFGGGRARPQDVWMTGSGTEADLSYSIPTVDSDRVYFRIASRESAAIRHLVPLSQLMLLTNTAEMRLTPINDDAITPSSISVRPQSFIGSAFPQPMLVNNTVVFAAARGGHLREMGYSNDVLGYLTGDLSLRAQHLFDNLQVVDLAYQKAPVPTIWVVSSDGKLLSMTYVPEEGVGAWSQHTTDGTFESVAAIPEGDEDAVYVVVLREGVRYVERFADQFTGRLAPQSDLEDAVHLDASLSYSGAATTTIVGLVNLEGRAVSYLADGVAGTGVVEDYTLTLPTAASKVVVGLPFTSEIDTFPLYMDMSGFGSGSYKNVTEVWVRVFESGSFEAGPFGSLKVVASNAPTAGTIQTGMQEIPLPGLWGIEGQVTIRQSAPLPLTVVSLTMTVATGN